MKLNATLINCIVRSNDNLYLCTKNNMSEKSEYWIEIADYDIETAKAMLVSKRFLYVGFMCHQAIEKTIKAYYCSVKNEVPQTESLCQWIKQQL